MLKALLSYCDGEYIVSPDRCFDCDNECQGGCEQCLDAIHLCKIDREYNCPNITYYYTCKYCYKYSSEIDVLISKLSSLKNYDKFNVLSIGCGPCTELVGLYRCMSRSGFDKPLTYVAFEINEIWKPIHRFYKSYFSEDPGISLRYSYTDACQAIPRLDLTKADWRPNILFLQYVISDMQKASMSVKTFIDNLLEKVIPHMPVYSYIIVNDINHYNSRQWFDYLEKRFCQQYNYWKYKGHFENNRRAYSYGIEHGSNRLTCKVDPDIDRKYNPWKFCSSAHLVLKKRGEK